MSGAGQQKMSKEGWRKQKELEEARKAGTAPAEVDESGRDINPHIPQYIKSAPWYVSTGQPTLKHQRPQPDKQQQFDGIMDWYARGVDTSKKGNKYRKGACENCGATTHNKRDCMERPRKVGARYSGDSIACDEFEQPDINLDYDGKRDRWNGFTARDYDKVMEEHALIDKAKQQMKAETLETELSTNSSTQAEANAESEKKKKEDSEKKKEGGSEKKKEGGTEERKEGESEKKNEGDSEKKKEGDSEKKNEGDSEKKKEGESEKKKEGDSEKKKEGDSEKKKEGDSEKKNEGDSEKKKEGGTEERKEGESEKKKEGDSEKKKEGDSEKKKKEGESEKKKEGGTEDDGESENEEMYAEKIDVPGQKFDSKLRTTVRNLRIREDTAKYLLNLNLNSAYYDPKSRSMRDNPYVNSGKIPSEVPFAGENFVRSSGETAEMARAQLFSWEAFERGVDLHLQGEPTKAELLYREVNQRKDAFNHEIKQDILDKYGGEEYLKVPPKDLIFSQNESYVEYSRTGRVVKGQERAPVKSKYEEDQLHSNHTAVWGSYWKERSWGYSCCHSLVKLSYCTGVAGQEAERDADRYLAAATAAESPDSTADKSLVELHRERLVEKKKNKNKVSQEEMDRIREEKVQEAIREIQQDINEPRESTRSPTDRKRAYNSMKAEPVAPSEEQMEAYHRIKKLKNDPMSDFIGKDY